MQLVQLPLGVGKDGSRNATLENALSVAGVFGLPEDAARALIDTLRHRFLSQWETVYAECGVPPKDFNHLSQAFINHLA